MVTSDGGRGTEVAADFGALHGAEVSIAGAASDLDGVGADVPGGDFGEAAALVANLLAAYTEVAAQLVTEAKILALGVRVASGGMSTSDLEQAVDFMEIGR